MILLNGVLVASQNLGRFGSRCLHPGLEWWRREAPRDGCRHQALSLLIHDDIQSQGVSAEMGNSAENASLFKNPRVLCAAANMGRRNETPFAPCSLPRTDDAAAPAQDQGSSTKLMYDHEG